MAFFRDRRNSFSYAFKGIGRMFRTQPNAKIHLAVFGIVVIAGFLFKISLAEWALVVVVSGVVFAAEAFNTALETLADHGSPERNEKVGFVKDVAAGAVLISAMAAVVTGIFIFLPKILHLF
jgi:diacylglycerol kinase (ATP)